ncbi:hypothetical protein FJU11_00490 [Pararhizobium mangrovi]|uniref:Uncharacterized protein n=1 Tax=Pararhizobium mangrovi TaxID=2590452 RepID=A0A506UHG0_9HYPH|nr:hypothetical protein FJU11_00490 [Pararhizobium mangrovi]
MPGRFPRSRIRCANLAETRKAKQKQSLGLYKGRAEKRERLQNRAAVCKTNIAATAPPACSNKFAVPAGPRNGDTKEKHASAFEENSYHEAGDAATRAAAWYAANRAVCPRPIVPNLKARFDLTAAQAVEAIRRANGGMR